MSLPTIDPTTTKAWKKLNRHFDEMKSVHMTDLFAKDPNRAMQYSVALGDLYLDYSKNRVADKTMGLLRELAEEVGLKEAISKQFSGEKINQTENRAVLHTALRDLDNMKLQVRKSLDKMKSFSEDIINGKWKGFTGKPITHIVNIGIGGSDLGPKMVTEALAYYRNHLQVRFISNVDGDHVLESLKDLDRETTLFIVVSKSFTTQETLTNASAARDWFLMTATENDISNHFVAVSSNILEAEQFGIDSQSIFPMWDWVGGRFSLWGTVGLSICCAVGFTHFEAMLKGAYKMDLHFRQAEFFENIPVILALLAIWYNNFFGTETTAVIPYSEYLSKLVPYLQQVVMESNGKSIDRKGESINYQTGAIVWGSTGTNAQHAFFQLIHQGTKLIPADFIAFSESLHGNTKHQNILLANCFAQSEALMEGTYGQEVKNSHNYFSGNKPSNTIVIRKLNPENLGSLLAMYEHKLFVQGIIWNIYSYDQWGVELGKKIAKNIEITLHEHKGIHSENPSTRRLLEIIRKP